MAQLSPPLSMGHCSEAFELPGAIGGAGNQRTGRSSHWPCLYRADGKEWRSVEASLV